MHFIYEKNDSAWKELEKTSIVELQYDIVLHKALRGCHC